MQGRKLVPLAVIGFAVIVAGCGAQRYQTAATSSAAQSAPDAAIVQKAAKQISDTHTSAPPPFPDKDSVVPCKIGVGGQPKNKTIDGTCSTAVRMDGANKVITFTETWNAESFRGAGSAPHGLLISVWQITVDPQGKVIHQTHTGDFPPQAAK